MKVPGGDALFDRMAEGAQGGPASSSSSFAAPVADVSGDAAGVEERLKSSFEHMASQNQRFLDVPELDRQVRDVRALDELGKLSTEERKRRIAADPRAKADQDAFDIVDKVTAQNADFYLDKAAGSPSIMDGYTPPPNTRPMDADKAQALAASTLQRFGLLDQAGVDAAKARVEAEAQATLGLPPELLGDNPTQAMRQAKEMGGAVESYARMYPVTAGFLHDFPNLVRDDWDSLNWLEKLGRQFNDGTMRGQAQVKLSQVMEDIRLNGITPERIAQARLYDQDMKNAAGMPMDTWGQKIVGNAAEQLPQFAYGMPEAAKHSAAFMGMAITGALATGGATAPLVLPMAGIGAKVGYAEFTRQMEGGLAFWELLNMKDAAGNHLDMTGIRVGSEIVGGINAALELAELETLAKTMPWAKRALSEVGREAALKTLLNPTFRQALVRGFGEFAKFEATEVTQEVLQELTQVASEEVNKAYARRFGADFAPTTAAELKDRLLDIAEKTAFGMVAFGGPGVTIHTVREVSQTPQAKRFLDPFLERIKGDKLAQEAPSAFQALMDANVKAGVLPEKVYMAPDKVLALFQDKESGQLDVDGLRDFLERAGVDRQVFLDRMSSQADVSFDTARLGRVLTTEAGQVLHSQGELTFSTRERAVTQAQAEVERAKATGDPETIATAEAGLREAETSVSDQDRETLDALFQTAVSRGREFRERLVADMVGAGASKTEAKANAALIDASAHVWSTETGQPVEEYYRLFGYRFRKTNFGNVLADIYRRDYAGVFKSEKDFFQRFDRNEGFRQEVLARVNLTAGAPDAARKMSGEMSGEMSAAGPTAATESAKPAPQNVRQDVRPGDTLKAPAEAPAAATVPTASSSPATAGAPAVDKLVAPGPTHEVVRAPARNPGGEGTILTPGGDAVPFRYAVMERADVHASHLPTQGFERNPEYAHTNERNYRANRAFQERVMERALPAKFQPEFLVGHSVDAINGAPIVDDTGSVLGGNSRKMILDLAFEKHPESSARYVEALRGALPALGLDPAVLDGMREPVLVRSLSRVYDAPNTAKLVSAFNQDFKAAMDSSGEGVSAAKFITADTAKTLAAGLEGFDTIRAYLDDKASQSFVEKMFRDGALPEALRPRIVSPDGTLNVEGKNLVVNALRGAVVDDYELIGRMKDSTIKKVDRVIPHLLRVLGREDQFNIQPAFKAAVALLTSWQNGKETETFKAYMNQAGLFTDQADPRRDPVVARLAMALAYNKELELARQFGAYADAAALNQPGRMALPGTTPSFEESLARIGVSKTGGKAGGQKMFFQDKRPEYTETEQGGELAGVVYTADGFFAVQRRTWAWGEPYALPIEQELSSFPDSRGMRPEQLLTSSQNALRVQAMAQQGDFVRHLQDLAGITGGSEVLARVKSSESLTRKVEGELQGELGQARDVLAGTITYDSLEKAAKAAKYLLESRPASEVVYFANRYSKPTPGGFRDFYFILRMPNGFLAELQVNTRDMVAAKEGLGHTLYEVERLMDSAGMTDGGLARAALNQVSQAFYQAAVTPEAGQGLARALEDLDNNMPELRKAAEAIVPRPILDNVVAYVASAVVNGRDSLLNYRVFDQAQPVNTTGKRGPLMERNPGRPVDMLFQDVARGDISQETAKRGDLAAVHNLSEKNLIYADNLGGLAMPSIGVTKAETPFQGFGDISLVGTPDLVDPKKTPVFDADGWTRRFPEILHPKVPMKAGQAFFKQHMDAFKETGELNKLQSEIWDDMVNKPNAKHALEVFTYSNAAKLMFLREQGKDVAIPRERTVTALNFMDEQGLAELREHFAQETETDRAGVGAIIGAAARRYAEAVYSDDTAAAAKLEKSTLDQFGMANGEVSLPGYDRAAHGLREEGKTHVASEKLRRSLDEQVNQEEFDAWAEARIMAPYGPAYIMLKGKKAPVTLDNLVEAMRGQKVNAQESGITFSPGKARAAAARKLTDASQYDAQRDNIVGPGERKEAVAAAEDVLEAYRMAAVKAYTLKNWRGETDYWNGFDASMKALAVSGGDPRKLQAALLRNDFQNMAQEVLDKGVAAYKAMLSVPVEYLEAKPQRAVLLSEFVGAAVPVNASQRVLDILEKNGIRRVEFYAKPEERGAAVQRIAQGQNVLFEDNGPHLPQGVTVFGQGGENQAVVHFFEAKDLSTAPHEIFHIFRRVLENMATREGASLKVRQDWALACEFVGAKVGESWTREQEEKWADAGLTYLMEGKSPSANLKGVFGRMKDWLLSLYRTFRNMVAITPEVRGVFDRLLATEDELKAAQADLHAVPLFTEGRAFDYDEATRELRQATEDEIMAYRVGKLAAMRKLWAQEGKAQADQAEHQVLIDALVREGGVRLDGEDVDSKTLQEIRKHRPGKLLVGPEGKLSMAEAADLVGKPTEQLLGWLASAMKKSAMVREFVAQQEKAFGEDFDASEAMMSERLEKVLELESKYLAQAVNGATYVSPKALKAWVREKTGQTRADQALVGEFDALKAALRREATAAERAFRAGKAAEALAAKERQRAVLAELRARLADQKQAATIQARAIRMADAALKKDSKVDWEFGEQLLRLVVHFGLEGKRKSIFPRQPERMPSLLSFIQAKDADGWTQHSGLIPEWLFAEGQGQLGRSHPNHWKNLTMGQLRDVDKALRYIYDAGRKEKQYLADQKEIGLVTVADKLIHSMDGLKNVQALADYKREGMVGGMTDNMRRAMAEITNMEYLWDQVDGWESAGRQGTRSGPAWEFIRRPLFESRTAELQEFGRVSAELEDILQPLRGKKNTERFELKDIPLLPEVREEWGGLWNHERVLAAALNMGNAGNLGAMKAGFGWTDEHLAIIAKQLTADEWRMVQRLWDLVDSLRPLINAAYQALHGQPMPLVEAKALQVETKDGQVLNLKGGYYPLIGDHRLNDKAGHFAEQDLMKNETMALFAPAKVKDSFTLKRTGMALPPRLSLSVLTRHVQQTIHYATHAVAVRNIQRIITLPEFAAQFKAKFGEHNYRMLTPWLKNIARPDNPEMGFWEGILEKWRTLGTISALGMNMQVAMLQLASIPQSAQDLGWTWLLRGYAAMANPARTVEMVKLVRELSPLMRDRLQDMDRDVQRNLAKYGPTNRKLQFQVGDQHVEVGMEEFQRWAVFGPISFSDACVAYPTWLGAFMKFQSQGKDEKTAARMADDVVLRAQSSGNPMSLSALQHGAGWRRLITMFASFTMNYQNRLRHYVRGLREGKVSGTDYARHLFNETLLPVVLTSIMLKLLKDNELPEPKDIGWDTFGYLLSGFPLVRGIPRVLQFGYGGVMDSPAFKGLDLTAKAGQDLIKAVTDGGNAKEHLLSFIKDATDLAGFATGVPTLPVYRFAKGVHDLASGEEKNPFRPFFSPSPDKAKH